MRRAQRLVGIDEFGGQGECLGGIEHLRLAPGLSGSLSESPR
ncbi:hypothetical protein ACQEU8_20625 [Streptomyces sp. CA-250714]